MVRLSKIYTKTGDKGQTNLVDGSKVSKHNPRLECYGTVDELLACLGLVRTTMAQQASGASDRLISELTDLDGKLARIQNELFNLGSDLATPYEKRYPNQPIIEARHVAQLEKEIDAWNAELENLKSFVLPGGTIPAAHLHLARTVCRRAERMTWALSESETVGDAALQYLNRLSDHLFVLSRHHCRISGAAEYLWTPETT